MTDTDLVGIINTKLNELLSALIQVRGGQEFVKFAEQLRERSAKTAVFGLKGYQNSVIMDAVADAIDPPNGKES